MSAPLLLDLSHTCHTRARTGVQRVARSVLASLGGSALPVTFDPHRRNWRELQPWEQENLAASQAGKKRGSRWPLHEKMRAQARRLLGRATGSSRAPKLPAHRGLLVPEIFSAEVAGAQPGLLAAVTGPRVAIFHDAIALKFPELTPAKTVARFPAYLQELLAFDGIAANSEDSRASLVDYWNWAGIKNAPPVVAIPLGVDPAPPAPSRPPLPESARPVVLCVGSIEGRKNHVTLLEACEQLWQRGRQFELRLAGLAQPQTAQRALERIDALKAAGRALVYQGPLSEAALEAAYAECSFTVYPSVIEGFGLPVLESLAHGKPCVCSGRGAIGESARDGGCVCPDVTDPTSLAAAIEDLLRSRARLAALTDAARTRSIKTWSDYTRELTDWMTGLPRRA